MGWTIRHQLEAEAHRIATDDSKPRRHRRPKAFTWTRETYRQAHTLHRLSAHIRHMYVCPPLVRRYLDLWKQHPQKEDPLRIRVQHRLTAWRDDDQLPF